MWVRKAVLTAMVGLAAAGVADRPAPAGDDAPTGVKKQNVLKADKERLRGTWQVAEIAVRGLELEPVQEDELGPMRAVFRGDDLEWRGVKLTYTIDPSRTPKQMDWTFKRGDGEGQRVPAIYELEGDTLKVCFANPGQDRPTEFKSVGGSGPDGRGKVLMFKRVKP